MTVLLPQPVGARAASSVDDASVTSAPALPSPLACGESFNASVTVQNTGSTAWTASSYSLVSVDPRGNATWGQARASLPVDSVPPGSAVTFSFGATAPSESGRYSFAWRMEGAELLFGAVASSTSPATIDCSLDDVFTGAAQFVEDTRFAVDRPGAFSNAAGQPGHSETSTVDMGPGAVPRYRLFWRTFVNPDGTKTSNGLPAGIALATSNDGNRWSVFNDGKPVLATASSSLKYGSACSPSPCSVAVYAPSVVVEPPIQPLRGAGLPALTMAYEVMDTGVSLPAPVLRHWIGAAVSVDGGMHWAPVTDPTGSPARVLVATVSWEGYDATTGLHGGNVGTPDLRRTPEGYRLSYHGWDGTHLNRGFASGPSLLALTRWASNPSFTFGTGWESVGPGKAGDVVQGRYTYRVYEAFGGQAGCVGRGNEVGWGLARSVDLVTWSYSALNPHRSDRVNWSCGEDMPSWQLVSGNDPMVVTTYLAHPLASQPSIRRYVVSHTGTAITPERVVGLGLADADGGYWQLDAGGGVRGFGDVAGGACRSGPGVAGTYVGIAVRPEGDGCWLATGTGRVMSSGSAAFHGDLTGAALTVSPPPAIVGIERAPDGAGYWLASADGRVWGFGSAGGSVGPAPRTRPQPIAGIVAPPPTNPSTGKSNCAVATTFCYWLVGKDGSVYPFNVSGYGTLPGIDVSRSDVVGMASRPDGAGYWLSSADGHVWGFGDGTPWYGDTGGYQPRPHTAISGMGRRATGTGPGGGYYLTAVDGGVIDFGASVYYGDLRGPGWND